MKRLFAILLTTALSLGMAGCGSSPSRQACTPTQQSPATDAVPLTVTPGESASDFYGIQVRVEKLTGSEAGEDLTLEVTWDNQTPHTVTYGAVYSIQRLEFEGWRSCAKQEELAFIAIGYKLDPGQAQTQTYLLTNTYAVSSPGVYRFRSTCYVQAEADNYTECALTAEFTVGDARRPDDAWKEGTDLNYSKQFLRPSGYTMNGEFPGVAVINSLKELSQRCTFLNEDPVPEEGSPVPGGVCLPADLSAYDSDFFRENYLIFLFLKESSGSAWHELRSVKQTRDNRICISIDSIYPEVCTADMACWYVVIELSREYPAESEKDVLLCWNGQLRWNGEPINQPRPEARYKDPPETRVRTPAGIFPMVLGSYSWSVENTDGTVFTTVADAVSRPLPQESLTPISIPSQYASTVYAPVPDPDNGVIYKPTNSLGYEITPVFVGIPSQIVCTRWPDTVWQDSSVPGETETFDPDRMRLYVPDGGSIYEFAITWPANEEGYSGTAYYYVHILGGDAHSHQAAQQPQTVDTPITGYCGNTFSTLHIDGKDYEFMGDYSVSLTSILVNLDYDPLRVCRCRPEYTADTEFGTGYGINLTDSYARCDKGQADLTQEQVDTIAKIIEWAKTTEGTDLPAG